MRLAFFRSTILLDGDNMKKIIVLLLLLFMTGCTKQENEHLKVGTTLFPQMDIVRYLTAEHFVALDGGEVEEGEPYTYGVDLGYFLPMSTSPHHFSPTPAMIMDIMQVDILFYTSLELEPWIATLMEYESDILFVDLSTSVVLHEENEDDHEDHDAEHGHEIDPHYWLDPINVMSMTEMIYETLAPYNLDKLEERYHSYLKQLDDLHEANSEVFSNFTSPVLLFGGHNSFGYFAERYNITYVSPYEGFSEDASPTPEALFTLIEALEFYDADVIYSEAYVEPVVADVIAAETGAKVLQLAVGGTISKEEANSGVTFIDLMYRNLEKMKEGIRNG